MDIETKKYSANELKPHPVVLKEVGIARRKEVQQLGDKLNIIVIEYGSQNIKAGYDWSPEGPEMVFRPQISKNRDPNKTDLPIKTYINTSYQQLDLAKVNYKSPYERNIILHFSLIQQCNDYIFSELVRPNKRVRSPLIVSEPFANPHHCRSSLFEQFFECYEVESVMIGVDGLFAYYYEVDCNMDRYETETALVINMGATSTHVFPIISGSVNYPSVRRLNIGGNNSFQLFARSLLLKNPHLKIHLSYSFLRDIYEKFTSVALDYKKQLKYFQSKFKAQPNRGVYRNKIEEENKLIQEELNFIEGIEIDFDTLVEIPEEQIRRKQEVRKRMADKLKQTLNRRKEMKKKMYQMELKNYLQLKEKYEAHDKFAHEEVVQIFGEHKPHDKLQKKIKSLQIKLGLVEEKPEENKFSLISIPDHELPPEKLKYKRLQMYQKQALQNRRLKQKEREQEENKMRELRENNPQVYLHQLKEKYKVKFAKMKENERIKNELNNRKSKLKQRKMQAMARLAQEQLEENFGENDDDWLAYKDPQESDHYSEIEAMEAELRQIDPQWTQAKDHHHLKETNQLFIEVDLIKCHEIYFQPLILGTNQMDLVETITSSISIFNPETVQQLLRNIVVVGGASWISGLKERLQKDLKRETPVGSQINVRIGKGGVKGAFLAMQNIGKNQREFLDKWSYKREQYLSKNGGFFIPNPWSNPKPFK